MSSLSFGCHVTVNVASWTPIIIVVVWLWSSIDVVVVIPHGRVVIPHGHLLSTNDNGIHCCVFGCHVTIPRYLVRAIEWEVRGLAENNQIVTTL